MHGNLAALNAVLEAYSREAVDKYVCLGDIVGYAAQPAECIAALCSLSPSLVAGNHDWAGAGLLSAEYFNPLAGQAVEWTSSRLQEGDKQFLKSLPLLLKDETFIAVHATLENPEEFNYLYDLPDAQATFALMDRELCFLGHTHIPGIFVAAPNGNNYVKGAALQLSTSHKYIVNVGSVGQPRDRNPQASYCIFDAAKKTIEIKRVDYDIKDTQQKIIAAGLPRFLAERLAAGV